MTPWPESLQDRFPASPGQLPHRPWWRQVEVAPSFPFFTQATDLRRYVRNDGKELRCMMPEAWDEIGHFDKHNPVRHPGFRAGQVWALVDDEGIFAFQIVEDYEGGPVDAEHPNGRWFSVLTGPGTRLSAAVGERTGLHLRTDRLATVLARAHLLADPCCPHLAPWSPT